WVVVTRGPAAPGWASPGAAANIITTAATSISKPAAANRHVPFALSRLTMAVIFGTPSVLCCRSPYFYGRNLAATATTVSAPRSHRGLSPVATDGGKMTLMPPAFIYPANPRPGDAIAVLSPSAGLPAVFARLHELGLTRLREECGVRPGKD